MRRAAQRVDTKDKLRWSRAWPYCIRSYLAQHRPLPQPRYTVKYNLCMICALRPVLTVYRMT